MHRKDYELIAGSMRATLETYKEMQARNPGCNFDMSVAAMQTATLVLARDLARSNDNFDHDTFINAAWTPGVYIMNKQYHSTAPRPYRCALAGETKRPRGLYQVINPAGEEVAVFRNEHLANRMVNKDATLRVRSFVLGG